MRIRIANARDARALIGVALPPSEWIEVSQERIQAFADCTDDPQWLHVDPTRARSGPFGTTIAHGFLTLSMLTVLWENVADTSQLSMTINYGFDRVRFPAPLPSGSRVRGRFQVVGIEDVPGGIQARLAATVECEASVKPPCVADWVLRFYP